MYILRARVVGFSSPLGAQVRFMQRMGLPEEQLENSEMGMSDMPVPTVLRGSSNPQAGAARYRKETQRGNGESTRASKLIQFRKQFSEVFPLSTFVSSPETCSCSPIFTEVALKLFTCSVGSTSLG